VLRQTYTPLYRSTERSRRSPLFLEGNHKRLKFLNKNYAFGDFYNIVVARRALPLHGRIEIPEHLSEKGY